MFNLDVSGSMFGQNWNSVCSSVNKFVAKLGDGDLISGIVFNNEAKLISSMSHNDPLFYKPRSRSNNKPIYYPAQTYPNSINYGNYNPNDPNGCQIM